MNDPDDELIEKLKLVRDADSFLAFVRTLVSDREAAAASEAIHRSPPYGPDGGGWENVHIETFLEAAVAWAVDSREFDPGDSPANLWRRFAEFLYAGKHYE